VYRRGIITGDQLGRELEEFGARQKVLEARKSVVATPAHTPPSILKRSLVDWCQAVAERLKQFTVQERQRFLRLLVNEIIYEGKRVRIKCIIPLPEQHEMNRSEVSQETSESSISSRIASTASHHPGRNSDRASRIENMASYSRGRSTDCASWIENMASYTPARNPASEVGFELAKFLSEAVPLKDKLTPEFLRRLLQHNPSATLAEFRDELRIEYSIEVSPTALCRAFKRVGLDHSARRQLRVTSLKTA